MQNISRDYWQTHNVCISAKVPPTGMSLVNLMLSRLIAARTDSAGLDQCMVRILSVCAVGLSTKDEVSSASCHKQQRFKQDNEKLWLAQR